jgi:ArsR family transcriptional regulator
VEAVKMELSTEQFQRIAKAIADPNRLEMMRTIYAQPDVTCGCAVDGLPITAATASHHLKELESADLIAVEKCGRFRKLTPRRDVWVAYLAVLKSL